MVKRWDCDIYAGGMVDDFDDGFGQYVLHSDYAALAQSHARLLKEMQRFATVIERANGDPLLWIRLTEGTGIATPNGYRQAIIAAQPFTDMGETK
jgi:hypothetical protein